MSSQVKMKYVFAAALVCAGCIAFLGFAHAQSPAITPKRLHNIQASRRGSIIFVASSSDGTSLYLGLHDGQLQRWSVGTGKRADTSAVMGGEIRQYAMSSNGLRLATRHADNTVSLRDVEMGHELLSVGKPSSFALSPDGSQIATVETFADDPQPYLVFRQIAGPMSRPKFSLPQRIAGAKSYSGGFACPIAYSPDGKQVAFCTPDGNVGVVAASSRSYREPSLLLKVKKPVSDLVLTRDGKLLAVGDGNQWETPIYRLSNKKLVRKVSGLPAVFCADGKSLLVYGINQAHVRSVTTGKSLVSFLGQELGSYYPLGGIAYHPNGNLIAVAFWEGNVGIYKVFTN